MLIYYILLIGLTAIGIPFCKKRDLLESRNKILNKIYLAIVFFSFFIIAAIRKGTGYDYNLYASWYYNLNFKNYEWITNWSREKGFAVPFKILTVITPEWQMMFVIISLIIALGVVLYIYKFSSCAYISVAAFISLGLYYNSMNFMRQFIAAIIISFALNYINTKQPLRFLVLILFASCFHFSALLMIPFYFILKIKMNWIVLGVYSAFSLMTFVFSIPLSEFVTGYFYKTYDPMTNIHMLIGLPAEYTVIFAALFLLFFIFRKELIKKSKFNSILINAYFFAIYFEFLGIKHSILSRFALLFLIAPILTLTPDLIIIIVKKIKKKFGSETLSSESKGRLFSVLVITAFCVYGLIINTHFLFKNYNGVVPYQTIFEQSRSE